MIEFFNAQLALNFAEQIAMDFDKIFIEEKSYVKNDKEQKIARRYNTLIKKTEEFKQANKLNFYKKGKLLTHLKFRLLELGHDEAQASHAVKTLITRI
jgi:hypothetical protein